MPPQQITKRPQLPVAMEKLQENLCGTDASWANIDPATVEVASTQ